MTLHSNFVGSIIHKQTVEVEEPLTFYAISLMPYEFSRLPDQIIIDSKLTALSNLLNKISHIWYATRDGQCSLMSKYLALLLGILKDNG